MWKRLNFCGSEITLKKEAGSGSEPWKRLTLYGFGSGSKNILPLPHPWFEPCGNLFKS